MSVNTCIRPDLMNSCAYEPSHDHPLQRMHMNELPWARINSSDVPLNQYPDPQGELRLQNTLADIYEVKNDQLMLTRGSDEGIDYLMRLFLRPGLDSILQCPPTFFMYAFFAKLQQGEIINCSLKENNGFDIRIEAIQSLWRPQCKLIMLCSPNNPTGNLVGLTLIADLCQAFQGRSVIVVDEAYVEFSNQPSACSLIAKYDNLIVLRTLSKAYGLAGLRIGSILAQNSLIQSLRTIAAPYRFSNIIMDLAVKTLADIEWFKQRAEFIRNERSKLHIGLQNSPWIEEVYPSQANFILVKTPYALALREWALKQGVALRHYLNPSELQSCLRISVGDRNQNTLLLDIINSWGGL